MVKKNKLIKAGCLLLVFAISMATMTGCGNSKKSDELLSNKTVSEQGSGASGIESDFLGKFFGTEYVDLPSSSESSYMQSYCMYKDKMLYSVSSYDEGKSTEEFYLFDFATKQSEKLDLDISEDEINHSYILNVSSIKSGKIAVLLMEKKDMEESDSKHHYAIKLFNEDGSGAAKISLDDVLNDYSENEYVNYITYLENGNVAVNIDSDILILNEAGELLGKTTVSLDYVNSMTVDPSGRILVCGYGMQGVEAVIVNPDKFSTEGKYDKFPSMYSGTPYFTEDGMILVPTDSKLMLYDPNTQKSDYVVDYLECEVIGDQVNGIFVTNDHQIVLFLTDWNTYSNELIYLKEMDPTQVVKKEEIILGTLFNEDQDLQRAVVTFNKRNDKYKIKIQQAVNSDEIESEDAALEALATFNNMIVTDQCPDIIDLTYSNRENLVNKNVLLNLNEFFDYTKKYDKKDFLPNVLDAMTINGVLTSIPAKMHLNTIIGPESILKDCNGWTIQQFVDICKKYPNAEPFNYCSKESMLFSLLSNNSQTFLNYTDGTCNFDNDEFKDILAFCNQFPEEPDYDADRDRAEDFSKHNVLFSDDTLWGMDEFQLYSYMFGEPVKIMGFPNSKGDNSISFNTNSSYGISAKTPYKEAIFEFFEILLEDEVTEYSYNNEFSTRQSVLEKQFEKIMYQDYELDDNGEKKIGADGEYVRIPRMTWGTETGMVEIYAATQEDVNLLKDAISRTTIYATEDYTLYYMIYEEAQPYFKGQKSIDETVKVIQSRMSMYVSEHY